ncbi:family 16 glycosylhydrolase [Marinilabilia sp.]
MRTIILTATLLILAASIQAQTQTVEDDFEGNGTITTWFGDACNINTSFSNPYPGGINTSETVMEYDDAGGQYANVRFDISTNYDLSSNHVFSLKIYVPGSGITGSQPNQVSLKLQDGTLAEPWSTQCEVIKTIELDQWQSVSFDFLNDAYVNFDANSLPPTQRTDFNRVVIQVNGENNNDHVVAYIDDVYYNGTVAASTDPEYDVLVWSDEFNGEGAIDNTNWHHQTQLPNGTSWYNGEIQHYTDRTDNAMVTGGVLNIIGKKETYSDQGVTKQYTSARLNSKYAFQYGKVEVRAQLPAGAGTWPAIWTLGKNINEDGSWWDLQGYGTTAWPACGEIDIMEHWGTNQNFVQSATHTPSSYGGTVNKGGQTVSTASTEFHTYTLQWYPEKLVFSVDGITHYTYKPNEINSDTWPFDAEQFLLLNFAILPEIDPSFVADTLKIDYVRVYQSQSTNIDKIEDPQQLFDLNNTPNPADDYTLINYHLPMNSDVQLFIHDINGRLIQTLINEKQNAGQHQVRWDVKDLPAGVYIYTLQTEGNTITRKCIVEK